MVLRTFRSITSLFNLVTILTMVDFDVTVLMMVDFDSALIEDYLSVVIDVESSKNKVWLVCWTIF